MAARLTATLIILLALLSPASSAPLDEARVKLRISSTVEKMASQVQDWMTQELGQLPGVKVVGDDPRWILDIVAMELRNQRGFAAGYVLSMVVLDSFDRKSLAQMRGEMAEPDEVRALEAKAAELYSMEGHAVFTGPPDELEKRCRAIVADFYTGYVEPSRTGRDAGQEGSRK